jgi:hypothetical protein
VDDIAGDHSDEDEDESGSKDDLTLSSSSGASTPASTPVSSPFPGRKGTTPPCTRFYGRARELTAAGDQAINLGTTSRTTRRRSTTALSSSRLVLGAPSEGEKPTHLSPRLASPHSLVDQLFFFV